MIGLWMWSRHKRATHYTLVHCDPSLLSSRPSALIFLISVYALCASGRLVEGLCRQCEFQLISLSYCRRCVLPGDIVTLHSLHNMWGGGASRGILRCLVLVHEPMAERNCPFCVLAGCPQWVCIWIIYLYQYMFVVGAFVPALYCTSSFCQKTKLCNHVSTQHPPEYK
jgi:hypothetical protein